MKHTSQSAVHIIVTYMLLMYELRVVDSRHEYYVHTISIQPVLVVVVTLIKLLHYLKPLITHQLTPILMVSDIQTHNVSLKSKNAKPVGGTLYHESVHPQKLYYNFFKQLSIHINTKIMPNCKQHVALPHYFIPFATQDGDCQMHVTVNYMRLPVSN